jgi:hypothetical protein
MTSGAGILWPTVVACHWLAGTVEGDTSSGTAQRATLVLRLLSRAVPRNAPFSGSRRAGTVERVQTLIVAIERRNNSPMQIVECTVGSEAHKTPNAPRVFQLHLEHLLDLATRCHPSSRPDNANRSAAAASRKMHESRLVSPSFQVKRNVSSMLNRRRMAPKELLRQNE